MSDHVAFFLGTHGPSVTLDTACSSFMVALAGAVSSLRQGDCDYAIVAGCNLHEARDFTLSLQVSHRRLAHHDHENAYASVSHVSLVLMSIVAMHLHVAV